MTRSLQLGSLIATIASLAIACSGADDAVDESPGAAQPTTEAPSTEPATQPADSGIEPKTPNDIPTLPDASTPDAAPKPKDAFDGAPAYVASLGPTTRQAAHSFNSNVPKTNPAGKVCLNCHRADGPAPAFAAAGTVYDGATPAASVEVRAIGADGAAQSAYTDADGNFYFRTGVQPIAFPAMVGVRNATRTRVMSSAPPKGSCNECHSIAGGAGRILVSAP